MAKPTILKERGTNEELYPQTLAKFVQTEGGDNVDEAIDKAKVMLFRDKWLATLNMFPKIPTYDIDVANTSPDGSQYGLNGLVMPYDIAMKVMIYSKPTEFTSKAVYSYDYTLPRDVPTLFPVFMSGSPDASAAYRANNFIEACTVYSLSDAVIRPISITTMFSSCYKLSKIYGIIDLRYISNQNTSNNPFTELKELTDIKLLKLKVNIAFASSPLLSSESLAYMVNGATNTSPITITVHPTVYAKLTDESNTEWNQILIDAAAKNISFATV